MRPNFETEIAAFRQYWKSKNRSVATFEKYSAELRLWHSTTGAFTPTLVEARAYVAERDGEAGRWAAYWAIRALKSFAKYLANEDDEPDALKRLRIPDMGKPNPSNTPTAKADEIDKILRVCDGSDIWDRRDHAIISVLRSTGMRRSEVARMQFDHVDLATGRVIVPETKGDNPRTVRLSEEARLSLRRYLRALRRFENERSREGTHSRLWASKRFHPLTSDGLQQMLRRRAAQAGVRLTAHSFRRGFAVAYLAAGGSETYLMQLAGWRHRDMVHRYTKVVAVEEALKQHEQLFG